MGESSVKREKSRGITSSNISNNINTSGNINTKRSYSTSTSTSTLRNIEKPDNLNTISISRRMKSTSITPNILSHESTEPSTTSFSTSSSTSFPTSTCTSVSSSFCPPGRQVSYSSSFTIVPTYECFNLCTYCNFRTNVRADESHMMTLDNVKKILIGLKQQNESMPLSAVHEILVLSGMIRHDAAWCLFLSFLFHFYFPLTLPYFHVFPYTRFSLFLLILFLLPSLLASVFPPSVFLLSCLIHTQCNFHPNSSPLFSSPLHPLLTSTPTTHHPFPLYLLCYIPRRDAPKIQEERGLAEPCKGNLFPLSWSGIFATHKCWSAVHGYVRTYVCVCVCVSLVKLHK